MKTQTQFTRSEIFTAYNRAKAAAKRAGDMRRVDRLNKALGILLSKDYYSGERAGYLPTVETCGCKDWEFRSSKYRKYTGPCKHMLAEMMAAEIMIMRDQHNVTEWITRQDAKHALTSTYSR